MKRRVDDEMRRMSCEERERRGSARGEGQRRVFECRSSWSCHTHLEDAGEGEDESRGGSDEEDGGDVEREGDGRVGGEDEGPDSRDGVEGLESLGEGENARVNNGADGRVIVERNQGIHLESVKEDWEDEGGRGSQLGRRVDKADEGETKQTLNHDEAAVRKGTKDKKVMISIRTRWL